MVRQILGAVSQFEKAMLVAKLKGARERKRAATGKCEGRKTYAERSPQMVTLAKRYIATPSTSAIGHCATSQRSLRPQATPQPVARDTPQPPSRA